MRSSNSAVPTPLEKTGTVSSRFEGEVPPFSIPFALSVSLATATLSLVDSASETSDSTAFDPVLTVSLVAPSESEATVLRALAAASLRQRKRSGNPCLQAQ